MNGKKIIIFIFVCVLAISLFNLGTIPVRAEAVKNDFLLQIYLPRDIKISSEEITLGQISILRGNQSMVSKAEEICLGRFSMPGQKVVINRSTLLSRLASYKIIGSQVKMTGAQKVTVTQQQQLVSSDKFLEAAKNFLKNNLRDGSICQFEPIRVPDNLMMSDDCKDVKLIPCLAKNTAKNQASVRIEVMSNGKKQGSREVTFRLKYYCRKAIALVDINKGTVISPENVKIEKTVSNRPEPADWTEPYGLIARRTIAADNELNLDMVGAREFEVVVKRGKTVVIRVERPRFLITTVGQAMQDGKTGDFIKVRNMDSRRVIIAKVCKDGVVEPVF